MKIYQKIKEAKVIATSTLSRAPKIIKDNAVKLAQIGLEVINKVKDSYFKNVNGLYISKDIFSANKIKEHIMPIRYNFYESNSRRLFFLKER